MYGYNRASIVIPEEIWDALSKKTQEEISRFDKRTIAGAYGSYANSLLITPRELSDHLSNLTFLLEGLMESQKQQKELSELRGLRNNIQSLKKQIGELK